MTVIARVFLFNKNSFSLPHIAIQLIDSSLFVLVKLNKSATRFKEGLNEKEVMGTFTEYCILRAMHATIERKS